MRVLVLLLFVALAPVNAGHVVMQEVKSGKKKLVSTVWMADGKIRADVTPQLTMLMDSNTGAAQSVRHDTKQFLEIPPVETTEVTTEVPELRAVGTTERAGGWEAEVFQWTRGELTVRYWLVQDFPYAAEVLAAMEKLSGFPGAAGTAFPKPSRFPGFPIKTELTAGKQKIVTTVLAAWEQELAPELFEVPEGYTEIEQPVLRAP